MLFDTFTLFPHVYHIVFIFNCHILGLGTQVPAPHFILFSYCWSHYFHMIFIFFENLVSPLSIRTICASSLMNKEPKTAVLAATALARGLSKAACKHCLMFPASWVGWVVHFAAFGERPLDIYADLSTC